MKIKEEICPECGGEGVLHTDSPEIPVGARDIGAIAFRFRGEILCPLCEGTGRKVTVTMLSVKDGQ